MNNQHDIYSKEYNHAYDIIEQKSSALKLHAIL